ncbi:MAG: FAD-dependent oxidoreductase [Polyangia bacterium]
MTLSRRGFLSGLLMSAATRTSGGLRAPVLAEDQIIRCVAGIRPFRRTGPRIERQELGGRTVVHNYGHGGAGFTLSWGSAAAAADLVGDAGDRAAPIAVLGAGVVGLSTARILLERGWRVRLYAREFPPNTTSDVAGAEWSPDIVDRGVGPAARARFDRLLVSSWRRLQPLIGARWGIARRSIYEADDVASGLDDLPAGLVAPPRRLASLPFAPAHRGRVYQTLLIEPPIYLSRLVEALRHGGAVLERRSFSTADQLRALPERVVVNCMGVGAGAVFGDAAVVPIRGQLVHLRPQPLSYLLDHPAGYLVPRTDALVVGGSFEQGASDARTDPATCARILDEARRFFAGPSRL